MADEAGRASDRDPSSREPSSREPSDRDLSPRGSSARPGGGRAAERRLRDPGPGADDDARPSRDRETRRGGYWEPGRGALALREREHPERPRRAADRTGSGTDGRDPVPADRAESPERIPASRAARTPTPRTSAARTPAGRAAAAARGASTRTGSRSPSSRGQSSRSQAARTPSTRTARTESARTESAHPETAHPGTARAETPPTESSAGGEHSRAAERLRPADRPRTGSRADRSRADRSRADRVAAGSAASGTAARTTAARTAAPARPASPRPPDSRPPRRTGTRGGPPPAPPRPNRLLRVLLTVASVAVLAFSGTAWVAFSNNVSTSSSALGVTGDAADGATDILLVGTDSRTDAQGRPLPADVLASLGASDENGVLNTDTMMLVRVPNDGSRAVAFSIPRDSYVPIPGTNRYDKINSAFPGAKSTVGDRLVAQGDTDARDVDVRSSEAGRQALVAAVQNLTGLTVDHYAEVNLLGFYTLTQAVGGVDVCLKNAVDEPKSGARFTAGPHTVAGHDALAFVRQRYGLPNGDLDRVRRQQAFLASLSHKVLSAGTLTDPVTLTRLLSAVKQSVTLDGEWDLLRFAQQMQGISAGAVAFMTIPTDGTQTTPSGEVLRVDPAEVKRYVDDAIGDTVATPTAGTPAPGTVPVDVRNASGTDGAAARVVSVLAAQGFTRTTAGNADPTVATVTARSTVLVGPGADAGAALVAQTLGGLPTRPDPTVPAGTVRVVLAADYVGPGAATAGAVAAAPAPPPPPPITADGVPCVD